MIGTTHRIIVNASGNVGELARAVFEVIGSGAAIAVDGSHVSATDAGAVLPSIMEAARRCDARITNLEIQEPVLESTCSCT